MSNIRHGLLVSAIDNFSCQSCRKPAFSHILFKVIALSGSKVRTTPPKALEVELNEFNDGYMSNDRSRINTEGSHAAPTVLPDAYPRNKSRSLKADGQRVKLSVIIPCYNEESTLESCVARVTAIEDQTLELEMI